MATVIGPNDGKAGFLGSIGVRFMIDGDEIDLAVAIEVAGRCAACKSRGVKRTRLKNNGGSYLSSHDPREVLGIGSARKIDALEIHWPAPSKQIDKISILPVNRYIRLTEGKGIVE